MDRKILIQLHQAICAGRKDQIKQIIADHELTDQNLQSESCNLLCTALNRGKTDVANLLLNHGCKVNSNTSNVDTPLHLVIKKGTGNLIKRLLSKGASKTAKDPNGFIPLHLAAKLGNFSIVKLLIQETNLFVSLQHYINTPDNTGMTALQLAVGGEHYEVAALLLEKQTDPNNKYKNGITAVYSAAKLNNEKIFQLLTNHGARIDVKVKLKKKTILHHAVLSGSVRIVQHVLQSYEVIKEDFTDLLGVALKSDGLHFWRIQELLFDLGFGCSAKDIHDTKVVLSVIRKGYTEPFKDLLEFGLDLSMRVPVRLMCTTGRNTLLHVAAIHYQKDIAELLLARGAYINALNDRGYTPLSFAVRHICGECYFRPIQNKSLDLIEFLLTQGACTDDRSGSNCLDFPVLGGKVDLVSLLLDYDANPDNFYVSGNIMSALQRPSRERIAEPVKLLLANGSKITVLDGKNRSVIEYILSNLGNYSANLAQERVLREEIMNILKQHAAKLLTADLLPKNAFSKSSLPVVDPKFQGTCSRELIKLKNDYLFDFSISFYAILTASQDELVKNLTEEMFENVICTDVLVQYPVYNELIRGKVKKASRRKKLIEKYLSTLCSISSSLPQNCVRKILSFLNNQEIRYLICISEINLTRREDCAVYEVQRKEANEWINRFEEQ